MTITQRFSVNENDEVIDSLAPRYTLKRFFMYKPKDEKHLREDVVFRRLSCLVSDLIVSTNPIVTGPNGKEYHPYCEESFSISRALYGAIDASHLNTLDVALSLQYRFGGELKREKVGWQDCTSLSLFVDDVERLLRDLYGDVDNGAIERVRGAALTIVEEASRYLRNDLWEEHKAAQQIDHICGIGLIDGGALSWRDHRRANEAVQRLECHALAVHAHPGAFSKYTVEFVKELYRSWYWLAQQAQHPAPF